MRYRLDGSLFDLKYLSAKTKALERMILEALFVDDCTLMTHKKSDLWLIVDKLLNPLPFHLQFLMMVYIECSGRVQVPWKCYLQ